GAGAERQGRCGQCACCKRGAFQKAAARQRRAGMVMKGHDVISGGSLRLTRQGDSAGWRRKHDTSCRAAMQGAYPCLVTRGLDPRVHAAGAFAWIAGSSPAMTNEGAERVLRTLELQDVQPGIGVCEIHDALRVDEAVARLNDPRAV